MVFDQYNGRTQLLAYPADLLLCELQKGSRTVDELAQVITAKLRTSTDEATDYVQATVQSLSEQGLVMLVREE